MSFQEYVYDKFIFKVKNEIYYHIDGCWVKYKLEENIEKEIMQLLDLLVQILSEDKSIKSDMLMSFKINRKMICKNNKNNHQEAAL